MHETIPSPGFDTNTAQQLTKHWHITPKWFTFWAYGIYQVRRNVNLLSRSINESVESEICQCGYVHGKCFTIGTSLEGFPGTICCCFRFKCVMIKLVANLGNNVIETNSISLHKYSNIFIAIQILFTLH